MAEIIWTNHLLKRLKDRNISEGQVLQTVMSPDSNQKSTDGKITYKKKFGPQTITAIGKENESYETVILSVWIDPPNLGTSDFRGKERYKASKKASFIKKFWFTFLNQIGL